MDKIREAFQTELDERKLSKQAKERIVAKNKKQKFRFVPIVTVLALCICTFFIWTALTTPISYETELISSEPSDAKDLEASIVQITNETIMAAAQQQWNPRIGEAFPMRLALEQGSGLFYTGSMLKQEEQMLLSEFLHYLQVAHVADDNLSMLQPFQTVEEIVEAAPAFIQLVIDEEGETYKTFASEKRYIPIFDWQYYQWVIYITLGLIAAIIFIWLWREHYRVPPILLALVGLIMLVPNVFNLNNNIGYDEASMAEVLHDSIEGHIRLVGEPTIVAVAGTEGGRYILLSYEDGLNVLGEFPKQNGRYHYRGASWHSGNEFRTVEFLYNEDGRPDTMHILATTRESGYEKLIIRSNLGVDVLSLTKDEPNILLYKTAANEMEWKYE